MKNPLPIQPVQIVKKEGVEKYVPKSQFPYPTLYIVKSLNYV